MTPTAEHAALVVLLRRHPRPGDWPRLTAALERERSAFPLLAAGQQSLLPGPEPDGALLLQAATEDLRRWHAAGHQVHTVLDATYPSNLRAVHARPPLLFIDGAHTPADERAVAIVGTRRPTPHGLETAAHFAAQLAADGYTIVSGLAAGIDAAAHNAALHQPHARTTAVIGTGLERVYPPEHADLQHRIAQRGAVVSQFWPDAPPSRQTFPMRNAVMSGISRGSIVIEASEHSGTRTHIRQALAHGRPVLLHARMLRQPWARELATRPGVYVVERPKDVAPHLPPCRPSPS